MRTSLLNLVLPLKGVALLFRTKGRRDSVEKSVACNGNVALTSIYRSSEMDFLVKNDRCLQHNFASLRVVDFIKSLENDVSIFVSY